MKSVVVEIKAGYAAVLSEDGCISKIKNRNYIIGQVIEIKSSKFKNINKLVMCSALTAMIAIAGGITLWAYKTPYSYVSLDVNPSIEYSLNRFDKVISVTAVNDDGQEILNELELDKLENQNIEDAVAETVNQISKDGYFDNNIDNDIEGGIIIATSGEDLEKSDELAEKLQKSLENEIEEIGEDIKLETISVGLERVQKAKELGVTPGKLNLVEKLQNSSTDPESIVVEEWLNKPVKDIMSAIKENKKAKVEQNETSEESTTDNAEVVDEIKTDKALTKEDEKTNNTEVTQERSNQNSQNKVEKVTNKSEKTEEKSTNKPETTEKKNNNTEKTKEKTPNKPENPGKKGNDKSNKN
ncbi:hypothetical protein [Clostridium sp.]|uniref:anti-sigma-I factor RsgI family protein n=1 Tax=Clostridium sp. TaxID=1506 RepID=UPI003217E137